MRRIVFLTLLLAAVIAGCSSPSTPNPNEPPKPQAQTSAPGNATLGSREWFQWVDSRLGISDNGGHGPDYGSAEWNNAVQQRLGQEAPQSKPGTPQWQQAVDALLRTRATPAS